MAYIRIPIETNPDILAQQTFDYIKTQNPNWSELNNSLDVWIIRAICILAAQNRAIASDVQDDIFRYFGLSLVGLPPNDSISAIGTTTWTLNDSLGHTIPAGTMVGIRDASNNLIPFQTIVDITVAPGSSATTSGEVTIRAVDPGVSANDLGLGVVPINIELIDVLDWVAASGVSLVTATTGGVDAESDSAYLTRLATKMRRLSTRPILPDDFSSMALDADPTIYRVVALDGYNPGDNTYNNERMITLAGVQADGTNISGGAKTAIESLLESNREITFEVHVIDPTVTTINVATSIKVLDGFDSTAVHDAVVDAIHSYINKANWGIDPTLTDFSARRTWIETPTIYYNNVLTVIGNVTGVGHVTALTLNTGTANINLTLPAALAHYGTVAVTIV